VLSVNYSHDGHRIIAGLEDDTIQVWDAKTSAAAGKPLEGHTGPVWCVKYSPDGQHIISGSGDKTIRTWDAKTGDVIGMPLRGHSDTVRSISYSPDGKHIVSGSWDTTIHVWESHPDASIQPSCNPIQAEFFAKPDAEGWVRGSNNGLLYWVPPDCRTGLHSPALLTIPPTSHTRTVSLDFVDFAFGTDWTQIFNSVQS